MLAEMLEYRPAGESTTAVFTYLVLQCFPREICVLSEDYPADKQAITDKADRLIALHVPQGHNICAAVAANQNLFCGELVAATQEASGRR